MPDLTVLLLSGLAVLIGAVLQAGTGIGLALISTPVVQLLDHTLMPGALLVVGCGLALLTVIAESTPADWSGLSWAFGGRLVGTAGSAWALALTSVRGLHLITGLVVLVVALIVALAPSRLPRNRLTLAGSGIFAGLGGTSTALGGPLIALVYSGSPADVRRSSLGVFTAIGALLSLVCAALIGLVSWAQIAAGLALLPFAGLGFVVSARLRKHLEASWIRNAVLVLAIAAALVLIVRSLLA